jgi:RNA polymerase sigma-70 factor (ECF subfamily)
MNRPIPVDDPNPTRPSLLEAVRDWNNHEGWRRFHETYRGLIHNTARSQGLSEADAQDVVQETLLSLAQTMPDFHYDPARCSFKTWLFHLTRKRIADELRRQSRQSRGRGSESEDETEPSESPQDRAAQRPELEEVWDREWTSAVTEVALEQLKEKVDAVQFQIFYLHCIKGQPPAHVARALDVSAARIYLVKHRLKGEFQALVERVRAEWG